MAPAITPAAIVLPRLSAVVAQLITSLDQKSFFDLRSPYVPASRRATLSSALAEISRYEIRSSRYRSAKVFLTQFGTVLSCTYRQGLDAPFMVELFALAGFARDARAMSFARSSALQQTNSPRRPALNEAFETCTRIVALRRLCLGPHGGITFALRRTSPIRRPRPAQRQACPGRPNSI